MSDQPSFSLVNLGPYSKPVDTFIKKVSGFIGGAFEPNQIKRVAKAEAEAAVIIAESEILISDLQRRAAHRWLKEEERHQRNMEEITTKAIPLLKDDADPAAMEDDWIASLFDKSRNVSDSEMQVLWARILAGEANAPGTFSMKTINILSSIDKTDAKAFAKLCAFVWVLELESEIEFVPLVLDVNAAIYGKYGIDFVTLCNLESMGLLFLDQMADLGFFPDRTCPRPESPKKWIARYQGRQLLLDLPKNANKSVRIGHTFFTRTGKELFRICESKPVDGFFEYISEEWKQYLSEVDKSEEDKIGAGYAILEELVGFIESDSVDGSVNHDDLIYELRSKQ